MCVSQNKRGKEGKEKKRGKVNSLYSAKEGVHKNHGEGGWREKTFF